MNKAVTDLPILCVGALTMDTIFEMAALPQGAGKFIPLSAVDIAAGMAASQAATIARLGGAASLWASVGDDLNGARMVAQIEAEGVDCSHVRLVAGARSAFSTILVDQQGERTIVPQYDRSLLSEPNLVPGIEGFSMIMSDVRWPAAAAKALAAAKQAGLPAILDADVAPLETLEKLAPLASHIVSSEPAAEILTGEADPAVAVEKLAARFDSFVAVTAGGQGVFWFDRAGQSVRHSPAPKVVVRDTLAAGDVFHGAFALGLSEGRPMEWIMAFASAAAAIKCSRFGGRSGAPNRAETEIMMADFYGTSI